jgi:oleate hydratase
VVEVAFAVRAGAAPTSEEPEVAKAYLVGGGIAALSAAAFLIRDGGFAGGDIHVFEEQDRLGGSLDAAGESKAGYTMRGGRMFEAEFRCTFDLLSDIPSLDDPGISVTQDTYNSHDERGWDDAARLVDHDGRLVDAHSMGFTERDRIELVKCLATPERLLDGKRIEELFGPHFFSTSFWYMWCTTFAFEPWHSAIEFRRYLNRFVHLFPTFDTMAGIYRTRYNQYDSIVCPLTAWLLERGVHLHTGRRVEDLDLVEGTATTVSALRFADGSRISVEPADLVFVTNGSMTANSALGSDSVVPAPDTSAREGSWQLWHRLAEQHPERGFGNPRAFDGNVEESRWESFTVTAKDPAFVEWMEDFSKREAGRGGLMTLRDAPWLLTIVLNRQPVYRDQPEDVSVWWGYALFPDRPGEIVGKPMLECTGRENLDEVLGQLRLEPSLAKRITDSSIVVPCTMPYITSQFMVRSHGDRPHVIPQGSTNLAFIGQFAEVSDDVVFTVEYSVRTAWAAVATLLRLDRQPPPVYKGQHDPLVLARALETLHRN